MHRSYLDWYVGTAVIKLHEALIVFFIHAWYNHFGGEMMNMSRKKQLLAEYKNRSVEMGVISIRCKETDEDFLGIANDTKTECRKQCGRLDINSHPNKRLQELWNTYGKDGFELSVVKVLKNEEAIPIADPTFKLEALRKECFEKNPEAKKIWQ